MTDWTTCSVVQDKDGDLWGSAIAKGERWWANLGYFVSHTTDELEHHFGPITPVLDADGLPVVTPAELAAAWDEGHEAGCADPYKRYHECDCRPNPYRTEGDPR